MELIKENLKLNSVIGVENYKTVIENDIIVPDVNPDVVRILLNDSEIVINESQTANEKVHIEGMIYYKILYVSDETSDNVKGITTGIKFTTSFDVDSAKPDMKSTIYGDIEHIELNILNGRKINAKAIVRFHLRVSKDLDVHLINEINDVEDLQVLRKTISINEYLGKSKDIITLRDDIVVPTGNLPIKEILRNDVVLIDKNFRASDDKLILKGSLGLRTLYIGDDDEQGIQMMEYEMPYDHVAELPGIDESAVGFIDVDIGTIRTEISEDSDGELRVINCEVDLIINSEGFKERSIEIIEDAYGIRSGINIERETIKVAQAYDDYRNQSVYKDTLSLSEGYPDINNILNVYVRSVFNDYSINEDKVTVEGYIEARLLYFCDKEKPINCYSQEIPFKHTIDVNENLNEIKPRIAVNVESISYSMASSTEVDLRYVIVTDLRYSGQSDLEFAAKASEFTRDERQLAKNPGITVYFAKTGDNLWNIAKKYSTTIDSIISTNDISDQDIIQGGRQLIIFR